jgi:nucleoside-triphosphatase
MKNTIITGAVGAGKSTAIKRLVDEMKKKNPALAAGGFCTQRVMKDDEVLVVIKSCLHKDAEGVLFATQPGDPLRVRFWRDIFEEAACKHIDEGMRKAQVIILDEIGFLEKDCGVFLSKVHEALDGPIPVLAALRRADMPHINAIRQRPDVAVIDLGPLPYAQSLS